MYSLSGASDSSISIIFVAALITQENISTVGLVLQIFRRLLSHHLEYIAHRGKASFRPEIFVKLCRLLGSVLVM